MMVTKLLTLSIVTTSVTSQMLFASPTKFLDVASDAIADTDPSSFCNDISFCERTRAFKTDVEALAEQDETPDLFYFCEHCTPDFDNEDTAISFPLQMGCDNTDYLAANLTFKMWFYQDGIARIVIGEPDNDRFQISQ